MKKKRKYSLILVIVVFVLSMGVFFLLYYVDNKYTARGDQAIQGILYVREDDPLHYLTGEWEYYPDLLLTPGELEKHKGEYYSRYISIGEYGGMDLGDKDKSPFGSGTYRMTLVLPEKEKRYAIGLVEVFSSYNLYVNGNLVGQVGNPDPENYKEQIQNRVFTFEGKGNTEIMIAVTDRHSVSSGIQFVPVFGLPLQVNLIRGLSIVGDAVYLALTFCVFLFAVYMFVRTKKAEFCFFALLCICVMGCSSYPVLHAFVPVKVQPAYGLEALFYYLMFACVVVVQQKILCDEGRFPEILAVILAAAAGRRDHRGSPERRRGRRRGGHPLAPGAGPGGSDLPAVLCPRREAAAAAAAGFGDDPDMTHGVDVSRETSTLFACWFRRFT